MNHTRNAVNADSKSTRLYYHYDSLQYVTNGNVTPMNISVPRDGKYHLRLTNVYVIYSNNYTADFYAGFVAVSGFGMSQIGSVNIAPIIKRPANTILFPTKDPTAGGGNTEIINDIQLTSRDQLIIEFLDSNCVTVPTDRIICTLKITSTD